MKEMSAEAERLERETLAAEQQVLEYVKTVFQ